MIDVRRARSLGEVLHDALVQFKANVALIERDRDRVVHELTYAEVRQQVAERSAWLAARGVGPGSRVAILSTNRSAWLIAAMAVFHRGATLVPIDHKAEPATQVALLAHAKPAVLFVEGALARRLSDPAVPEIVVLEPGRNPPATWHDWEQARVADAPPTPPTPQGRDDVATIVYSSGTGGTPKGCMLTHGNYLSQWDALAGMYPMAQEDRFFSVLPTNHAIDFLCGFVGPLCCGAAVVHQRTLRPEFLASTMKAHGITHMAVVPMLLEAFERAIREKLDARAPWQQAAFSAMTRLNATLTRDKPSHAISSRLMGPIHDAFGGKLRFLFAGGAFVARERAEFFYNLGLPVAIGYGLTEACTVITVNDLRPFRGDTVGKAVPGVEVRIHEPDAAGIGEVWVRGPTVMRGYLDEPELTAETFQEGWLKTGDLGRLDGAMHLHLVGRIKNMIVTAGGKNIYPEDVEAALGSLPAVEELIVAAENWVWPRRNLGDERLIAIARARPGRAADEVIDDLRRRNRGLDAFRRLGGIIVTTEPFPRTASMKVQRAKLAEWLREHHHPDTIVELRDV